MQSVAEYLVWTRTVHVNIGVNAHRVDQYLECDWKGQTTSLCDWILTRGESCLCSVKNSIKHVKGNQTPPLQATSG